MADETLWITAFLTLFICWAALEFMERKLGMAPTIITAKELAHHSTRNVNPVKKMTANKRMTKSLDSKGKYRIQIRGTIYLIKAAWCLTVHLTSTIAFFLGGPWFANHFIWLDPVSMHYWPFLHNTASILVFYPWEIAVNRYGKLSWPTIAHHYVASAAALSIILGRFNPYATWYGYCGISMAWTVPFALGFRAQFGNSYPQWTRRILVATKYHYLFVCFLQVGGMIFLLVNAILWHPGVISWGVTIPTMFAIFVWVWDDWHLYNSLHSMSKMHYEEADVLTRTFDTERIHPRELFGKSVIIDMFQTSPTNSNQADHDDPSNHSNGQLVKLESLKNGDKGDVQKEIQNALYTQTSNNKYSE